MIPVNKYITEGLSPVRFGRQYSIFDTYECAMKEEARGKLHPKTDRELSLHFYPNNEEVWHGRLLREMKRRLKEDLDFIRITHGHII